MKLTARTRVEYRITTTPANLGYDGEKTDWLNYLPDCVGTPATILKKAYAVKRIHGEGVWYADQYRTAHGEIITRQELEYYEVEKQYLRAYGLK